LPSLKPLGIEKIWVLILLGPTLVGLLLGAFGSIFATVAISFFQWDVLTPPKWVGLGNYLAMPGDKQFMLALGNTTLFSALYVPLTLLLSFGAALLLNRHIPGVSLFRALYFLPVISSPTAVGLLWYWIYAQDQGVLNNLLKFVGLPPQQWLGPRLVLYSVVIVNVWGAIGEGVIVFLAGLQSVPRDYYDAAKVEGANGWHRLLYVTLPCMAPSLFFQAVLSTIHAFQAFDYIYILTRLGNGNSSVPTLVYLMYRNGFRFFRMGDATAQAVVLTLIIFALTLVYFRLQKRWVTA
jgi:multiple sugar transport system permease protein